MCVVFCSCNRAVVLCLFYTSSHQLESRIATLIVCLAALIVAYRVFTVLPGIHEQKENPRPDYLVRYGDFSFLRLSHFTMLPAVCQGILS